ncbi:MAG: T9SS type A sorting domain-containing protein [Saprospiraceae bacterium]
MKNILIVFNLLFISIGTFAQSNSIIMSTIGNQEVYENARITVYFSTFKHFDEIEFESADLPSFGTLVKDDNGDGRFIFDPTRDDVGVYTVTLNTNSEGLMAISKFEIEVLSLPTDAIVFYVDPVNGAVDNSGTAEMPFKTLTGVLNNNLSELTENAFVYLRSGFHGSPVFQGAHNNTIHIVAERNHTPRVKKLNFSFTTNWYVSGLDISPQNNNQMSNTTLVNVFAGSKNIVLTNSKIYSIEDASGWDTNNKWYESCGNGILSSGNYCIFKNNYLKNTWFSIEMRKQYNEFSYNIINWFGADAVRAIASHQTVNYNQIKNATVYDYDDPIRPQHDDGIQSWTFNLPVKDITIIGNQIVDIADPNLTLPTEIMQGIVDFDGFAEDWKVENNLVVTHHAHGIALYGAQNCKVTNNTVVRNPYNLFFQNFKPWIRINPRKANVGGDLSFGNLVRNNITASYQHENKEPGSADHNIIGTNYDSFFMDYQNWNFYLSDDSPAIDAGAFEDAPTIDLDRIRRDVGNIDAGCFEYNASLRDVTAPSKPGLISVDAGGNSATLGWEESIDNNGVFHYIVVIDDIEHTTFENKIFLSGLDSDASYTIEVIAVDFYNNRSEACALTFTTQSYDMLAMHFVPAYRHDQMIKSTKKLMWVGTPFLRVGGYYGQVDASAVMPFELPCIGTGRSIVSADLEVLLNDISGAPVEGVDLYSIGIRSKSDVNENDHWQGDFEGDNDAFGIVSDYLKNDTPIGKVSIDDGSIENFGNYIQNLYDDDGACQKYLMLRLNSSISQSKDDAYYKILSADNTNSFGRPMLKLISSKSSRTKPVELLDGLRLSPNPSTGIVNLTINGFENTRAVLVIHNMNGQEVFKYSYENILPNISLDMTNKLNSGMYYITLLSKNKYAQSKLYINLN